jgi:hypothetical protein
LAVVSACTNNPYPDADRDAKVLYSSFTEAPKTLDPAVAYTTAEHVVTANVFDTLLEYHYLRRPYELIPGLAVDIPKAEPGPDGKQRFRFTLRGGVLFHADPCFALSQSAPDAEPAADVAFQLQRLADRPSTAPSPPPSPTSGLRLRQATERDASDPAPGGAAGHKRKSAPAASRGFRAWRTRARDALSAPTRRSFTGWAPFTTPMLWRRWPYDG